MTKLLLSLGISPNVYSGLHKGTPLHHVASEISIKEPAHSFKHPAEIRKMDYATFKRVNYSPCSNFPQNITEENCWIEVAKLLLEHNADIEARDIYNRTPVQNAASCDRTEIVKLLLDRKANIEKRDKDNRTLFHHAVKSCYKNAVNTTKVLVEHNADIEANDKYNYTPLHHVVLYCSKGMVELLLEHNADIGTRYKDDQTPLHYAVLQYYSNTNIVKLLLEHKADIEARDKDN